MKSISLFTCLILIAFCSCDSSDGLFGHSISKQEAISNGSKVTEYLANKTSFKLLDGTLMQIDTAWTEESFTYKNGKRVIDNSYGYLFSVPVKNDSLENFTFTFSLLDTTNRMFTNPGPGKEGLCQLCPKQLYDEMKIVLEQKDTDTSKGWLNTIVTDTITFKKIMSPN